MHDELRRGRPRVELGEPSSGEQARQVAQCSESNDGAESRAQRQGRNESIRRRVKSASVVEEKGKKALKVEFGFFGFFARRGRPRGSKVGLSVPVW